MKLIAIFMLITSYMINPKPVLSEYANTTTSTQTDTTISEIDTILYIHDSTTNRITSVTIHPPSNKIEEKEYISYVYKWIPRTYTKNKDGTCTIINAHWDSIPYDTLYVNPCPLDSRDR